MRRIIILSLILTLLLIPVAVAKADGDTHVVQPGETLFRIALNHGVSVDALRAANGIVGNTIYAGQTLVIPGNATAPVAQPTAVSAPVAVATNGTHVVQRGENLFRIGLKYGLSWQALQAANHLASPNVYAGQTLIIPNGTSTSEVAPAPVSDPAPVNNPPAPVVDNPNPAPAAPQGGGKRFLVDLSDQMLYAYEGDTLVRSTLISSGRWPTTTVIGTFYTYLKYTSQRMRGPGYDLPGVPYVMYFYQGYALHGTYWHNNFGTPMSHGCVNMRTTEAEWAFNWAPIGTPVTVQN